MANIHPLTDVQGGSVGEGARVWQFAVVLSGAKIGRDCNICAHALIEDGVIVGDRVTVKSCGFLWGGTWMGDDVFIGSNLTFTDEPLSRSKSYPDSISGITVHKSATIGANTTPGIVIGENAMVGTGAVVSKDAPPYAVVVGNPARVIRMMKKND